MTAARAESSRLLNLQVCAAPGPTDASAAIQALGRRIEDDVRDGRLLFPPLPHVAVELGHLATSEDPDMTTAMSLVETDEVLTARVLRVASSPAFNGRKVTALSEAVMQLGVNGLRDLAFAASLAEMFQSPELGDLILHELLHAFVVAVGTARAGRMLKIGGRSRFLCGLFHDIGRLGVLMALPRYAAETPESLEPGFARAACDALHGAVGPLILASWEIESLVQDVARYHHEPRAASEAMALCLAVATIDAADEVDAATETGRVRAVCAMPVGADAGFSLIQLEDLAELVHTTRETNPMADMVPAGS